jgi:hypothetical protein
VAGDLLDLLTEAACGRPPAADGSVVVMPAPGPVSAVLAFTAHHVIAADIDADEVARRLPPDDLGAPMSPAFLLWLAGWLGAEPGVHDVLLAAESSPDAGDGGPALTEREDLDDHPRVQRAARYRPRHRVWSIDGDAGVLVVGQGLAGRWEMAYEIEPWARNRGLGRRVAMAARSLVEPGVPVFAQVSPGNAASLRAVLAAGFRPIGGEILFAPR